MGNALLLSPCLFVCVVAWMHGSFTMDERDAGTHSGVDTLDPHRIMQNRVD
jgi:hypothetical protein